MIHFLNTDLLAVGDFVEFEDNEKKSIQYIAAIENNENVWLSDEERVVHVFELKPVKIDSDWIDKIFKSAFPEVSISLLKNKFYFSTDISDKSIRILLYTQVKYVHQLQSLLRLINQVLDYASHSTFSK